MGFTQDDIGTLLGATVFDSNGDKLGDVNQVYLDDTTSEPSWVTVRTGLFGTQESFVPLRDAESRGGELHAAFDKATVRDAPRIDADGHLTPEEEQELYRYYGVDAPSRDDTRTDDDVDRTTRDRTDDDDVVGDDRVDSDDTSPVMSEPATTRAAPSPRSDDDDSDRREDYSDTDTDDDARRDEPDGTADQDDSDDADDLDSLAPGETRSRLRRYVVTERVTRTVEELPDDDDR